MTTIWPVEDPEPLVPVAALEALEAALLLPRSHWSPTLTRSPAGPS